MLNRYTGLCYRRIEAIAFERSHSRSVLSQEFYSINSYSSGMIPMREQVVSLCLRHLASVMNYANTYKPEKVMPEQCRISMNRIQHPHNRNAGTSLHALACRGTGAASPGSVNKHCF